MGISAPRRPTRPNEGRPTVLTPELADHIVGIVQQGNFLESAAALVGIARSTIFDWLRRGAREEDGPFWEFSVAIRRAQAEATAADLAHIARAARDNWRAAAWRLEHRNPRRYGRADGLGVEGEIDTADPPTEAVSPIRTDHPADALTEEDNALAARVLTQRRRDRQGATAQAVQGA